MNKLELCLVWVCLRVGWPQGPAPKGSRKEGGRVRQGGSRRQYQANYQGCCCGQQELSSAGTSEKYIECLWNCPPGEGQEAEDLTAPAPNDGGINSFKLTDWVPMHVISAGAKRKKKRLVFELVDGLGR